MIIGDEMKKYINVDVIETLREIMLHTTKHYRSDFDIDELMLKNAAQSENKWEKRFLWATREHGTLLDLEWNVFITDTWENNEWSYYLRDKTIKAYAVKIDRMEDIKIIGDIYQLDYPKCVRFVSDCALPQKESEEDSDDLLKIPTDRKQLEYLLENEWKYRESRKNLKSKNEHKR